MVILFSIYVSFLSGGGGGEGWCSYFCHYLIFFHASPLPGKKKKFLVSDQGAAALPIKITKIRVTSQPASQPAAAAASSAMHVGPARSHPLPRFHIFV